jgi:ubiquinone/menaquinone biosynthesis C-methylase UbiE
MVLRRSQLENGRSRALIDRYDREASSYRELWAPVLQSAGRRLIGKLRRAEVRRIVDVGTGVGLLLLDLEEAFPSAFVLGVDRSPGMLAMAAPRTRRAVMDAIELALPPASVDLVFMAFMLFHLESPLSGLREARRVLRGGGRVATLTWGREVESTASHIWNDCLNAFGAAEADPASVTRHESVDTPEKMEALLSAAGFGSVRAWVAKFEVPIELAHLLRLKTSVGSTKARFESLAPKARDACVAAARVRMQVLAPADFVARGTVVHAVASIGGEPLEKSR